MLVGTDHRAVDHGVFVIGVCGQVLEYLLPNAAFSPAAPTAMGVLPIAKALGQIAPRHTRAIPIKNRVNKKPVVGCRAANMTFASRQEIPDAFPLIVAQRLASCHPLAPPFGLILYKSHFILLVYPLTDDTP